MSEYKVTPAVMGWDVGGAHLKAVLLDAQGQVLAVKQLYCPLWLGLHELEQAIDMVLREINAAFHVVTMTGELADIFPDRHAGVMQIAQTMHQKLSTLNQSVRFYAGKLGAMTLDEVCHHSADIASMNWLASVQYIAAKSEQAIFIDIGSTTTDIAMVSRGRARVRGFSDATRMQFDELVYTGVVRTPLMAIAQKVPFSGQLVNVAAEHFATTADVYTLTGDLPLSDNMAETADGAEKNIEASARRIARMIGRDAADAPLTSWRHLAGVFKHLQLNLIKQAILTQISLLDDCTVPQIVGAGAGEFLVKELALQMGFNYVSVNRFIHTESDAVKEMTKVCFPAFAVASIGLVQ
ncbi:MAG: hydantoinase/oxoprolinase family protein [Methylotenera sp.]|nr:hydantoinase/oxoprolinase family protein [Methylotenera sp.]